ncbi:MAG: hypothetical protein ACTHY5_03420 [Oceanisphaera sp.]|uniref:hypothetical protein n=1 Tax=Oceanisphaera sp. TaxID=1929979 RepID=UPI003F9E9AF6
MSINVQLQPQNPVVPGQARLIIKKWEGDREGLEFSIQRNQDRYYLQQNQDWGTNAVWFPVTLNEDENGHLEGLIGGDILDPILESSGTSSYQLHLQQGPGSESDRGMVRLSDGLLSSAAGGVTESTRETGNITQPKVITPVVSEPAAKPPVDVVATPEPVDELPPSPTPEPSPTPQPSSNPAPVAKKRINPLFIILPIIALLAIAAGAAWLLLKPSIGGSMGAEKADETSCSSAGLDSQSELNFVQNCIQQDLSSEQMLAVIADAKAQEKCGVAQRLYANRAQSGDAVIALAYAQEYDSKFHQPNVCFSESDDATASYWYETVLGVEPENALAQQRLGELE